MPCPSCGHSEMEEKVIDKTISYGDCSATLSGMKGHFVRNVATVYGIRGAINGLLKLRRLFVAQVRNTVGADIPNSPLSGGL